MDFSEHRLNNEADLISYHSQMGATKFWGFGNKLFSMVILMKPGESFKVNDLVIEKNRDLFIKFLCWFIQSGAVDDFIFNDSFTVFSRQKQIFKMIQDKKSEVKKDGDLNSTVALTPSVAADGKVENKLSDAQKRRLKAMRETI